MSYKLISISEYNNFIGETECTSFNRFRRLEDLSKKEKSYISSCFPGGKKLRSKNSNSRMDSDTLTIRKFDDDWFVVHVYSQVKSGKLTVDIYLCDQFDGLTNLLKTIK